MLSSYWPPLPSPCRKGKIQAVQLPGILSTPQGWPWAHRAWQQSCLKQDLAECHFFLYRSTQACQWPRAKFLGTVVASYKWNALLIDAASPSHLYLTLDLV